MYQIQILWIDMCGSFWTPADDNYKWDWDSYKEELQYLISYDKLLEWAYNQESFERDFKNEIAMAEEKFFSNNYDVE